MNTLTFHLPVRLSLGKKVLFVGTFFLICLAPLLVKQQLVTGTVVNAALLLAVVAMGPGQAAVLGLFPSLFALSSGLLPAPLSPVIPCIVVSNAIFVYLFALVARHNRYAAVLIAAFAKFAFLSISSYAILNWLMPGPLLPKVAAMMSWPQLFTALAGGALVLLILPPRRRSVSRLQGGLKT